ncbi:hypothetical protein FOC4_g10006106 [Fusarium odoratissimum]|uniref:Uncharacterized protein n=1 Tax=Fusarium oxysporum f. sp. cubense (strain race 4) TaxID=2502994 RepID=N1R8H5_FUSC4|nr:hypothetical protein FOC4_g10006105 [Fusarium odoratissimum]EMT62489.1 hypothetical protein FOC4_g10006106 [Fusarium odoratissimum]
MQPLVDYHDNTCPKCNAAIEGGGKTCGSCGAVCLILALSSLSDMMLTASSTAPSKLHKDQETDSR